MQLTDNQGNVIDDLNPLPTKEVDSTIVKPVNIDGRAYQTAQTHNAVSVPLSGTSAETNFRDVGGYDSVGAILKTDINHSASIYIYWSPDGTNFWSENVITASTSASALGVRTTVKARYMKLVIINNDATVAHTISAWIYLLT